VRAPASHLVVDANILIAAARGRSADALHTVASRLTLITTERAMQEASRRLVLGMKRPELIGVLDLLAQSFEVFSGVILADGVPLAQRFLRDAVASRNGSVDDAHLLALAWHADADIWSTDHDFAGTGVASWSTPNLLRAFT
jgi:predicted nucleic acid-binding protein